MPAYVLDQSYTSGQDNDDLGVGKLRIAADNNQIIGQSFKPQAIAPLTKVEMYLKNIGGGSGNLWVEIHQDGADPTAAAQVGSDSALVDISTISSSYGYVEFTFSTPINLTPNTTYWILVYGDMSYGSTAVILGTDTSSPSYANGSYGRYGNGGAAWETLPTLDLLFKEYSDNFAGLLMGGDI